MKTFLLLIAMLLLPAAAHATQFDYSAAAVFDGQNVTITSPTSVTVDTGMIVLTGAGPQLGQTLDAWCVDLFHTLQSSAIYNIVPLTTAGSGSPNPTLTSAQISAMGSLMLHGVADVPGDPDVNASAAFQLAIWSIEFGGTLLDSASGPLATLVTALDARVAPGGIWYCPGCSVDLLDAPAANQVLAFGVPPVPIPGAVWLFGSALGGLAMLGRRKKKAVTTVTA